VSLAYATLKRIPLDQTSDTRAIRVHAAMSSHLSAKDYPGSAEIVAREQAMTSATAAAPRQSQIAFIFFKQMTHSAIP
jgi:hypothetical protein